VGRGVLSLVAEAAVRIEGVDHRQHAIRCHAEGLSAGLATCVPFDLDALDDKVFAAPIVHFSAPASGLPEPGGKTSYFSSYLNESWTFVR